MAAFERDYLKTGERNELDYGVSEKPRYAFLPEQEPVAPEKPSFDWKQFWDNVMMGVLVLLLVVIILYIVTFTLISVFTEL